VRASSKAISPDQTNISIFGLLHYLNVTQAIMYVQMKDGNQKIFVTRIL
jgi:hypothetical protein